MPEYQRVILLEACRVKDRLDDIDVGLDGKHSLLRSRVSPNKDGVIEIRIDQAVTSAKCLGETMAKHLATLRLTTAVASAKQKGGNPGGTRAAYQPGASAAERMRARSNSDRGWGPIASLCGPARAGR